jgi:hypothetical protein
LAYKIKKMQLIYYCSLTNRTGQGCNSKTDGQSRRIAGRDFIQLITRRRTNPFLPLSFLLASPLLSSTRWLLLQMRSGAGSIHVKGAQLSSNPSELPMVQNIRTILDSSDLWIMRVSSQTVAFQEDLCIHGLWSTIGATDQKVKFWSTLSLSKPNLNLIFLSVTLPLFRSTESHHSL